MRTDAGRYPQSPVQVERFLQFLRIREDREGKPILELFEEPTKTGDHTWYLKFRGFDSTKLPTMSAGAGGGQRAIWTSMWHGTKIEGLFAILASIAEGKGGLRGSTNRKDGHRWNQDASGVYFHADEQKEKIDSYRRYTPCMGDHKFGSAALHCYCDSNYRKSLFNRSKQKVFISNDDCREEQRASMEGLGMF